MSNTGTRFSASFEYRRAKRDAALGVKAERKGQKDPQPKNRESSEEGP